MQRALLTLAACALATAAAGCGSSSSSSSSISSSGSSSSSTTASTPAIKSSGLKANTTPKFASPSPSAPVQSGTVQIAYRNIAIDPDTLRVKVGSTIRWTNFDSVEHNVTSVRGPQHIASKSFGEGKAFEVKATKPGLIDYECTIHPTTMNGSIEVVR